MGYWRETLHGIGGEILLFIFTAMVIAAAAGIIVAFTESDQENAASIAMMFAISAGAVYTARGFYDKRKWKKLALTGVVAVLILMASFSNVASEQGISLVANMIGATAVFVVSCLMVLILYVFRISHLISRWRRKLANRKSGEDGR